MSVTLKRYERDFVFCAARTPINVLRTVHEGIEDPHDHDFVEVVLVTGGSATQQTIRGMERIGPGDLFVLRPGTWHAYIRCRRLEIYNVCFGRELLRHELAWMIDEPALAHLFWSGPLRSGAHGNGASDGFISLKLSDAMTRNCAGLLDELGAKLRASPGSRASHLGALLLFLHEIGTAVALDEGNNRGKVHQVVVFAMRLLEENLAHEWTLTELSRRVHLDRSYLVRLFRAATGLPPMAYLARCRAERAAGLLLKTQSSIAEIGAMVGWPEPYYFARRFKFHFGMSASRYRSVTSRSGSPESGTGLPRETP